MGRKCGEKCAGSRSCPVTEWSQQDWADFYHEVGPVFYHYHFTKLRNRQDAEDALQETFKRFFEYLDKYDSSRPLLPWLMRIAQNVSNDMLRERYMYETVSLEELDKSIGPIRSVEADIYIKLTIDWIIQRVRMSQYQAAILVLCVLEDFGPKEIAIALNSVPKNIRQHLWKTRCKIKERISREDL